MPRKPKSPLPPGHVSQKDQQARCAVFEAQWAASPDIQAAWPTRLGQRGFATLSMLRELPTAQLQAFDAERVGADVAAMLANILTERKAQVPAALAAKAGRYSATHQSQAKPVDRAAEVAKICAPYSDERLQQMLASGLGQPADRMVREELARRGSVPASPSPTPPATPPAPPPPAALDVGAYLAALPASTLRGMTNDPNQAVAAAASNELDRRGRQSTPAAKRSPGAHLASLGQPDKPTSAGPREGESGGGYFSRIARGG